MLTMLIYSRCYVQYQFDRFIKKIRLKEQFILELGLFHQNKCSIRAVLLSRQLWSFSLFSLAIYEKYLHAQVPSLWRLPPR